MGLFGILAGAGSGLLAGFVGSMLGLGGGFILVPILNLGFGLPMVHAVGTSLSAIFFNGISSTAGYWRQGRIDFKLASCLILPSTPTAILGGLVSNAVKQTTLTVIFSITLALAAARMAAGKRKPAGGKDAEDAACRRLVDRCGTVFEYNVNLPLTVIAAAFAGFLGGMLGIGGGIVNVPVFIFCGLPVHLAVATSSFLIIFNAASGAIPHAYIGNINYVLTAAIAPGVILGAQLGAMASRRLKPGKLRLVLSVVLFALAMRMIARAFDFWM